MILPDANVLLYAFRSDSVNHPAYREWLERIISSDEAYGMSSQVVSSVVRIATHPRIYLAPSRLEEALSFARVLLEQLRLSSRSGTGGGIRLRLCVL